MGGHWKMLVLWQEFPSSVRSSCWHSCGKPACALVCCGTQCPRTLGLLYFSHSTDPVGALSRIADAAGGSAVAASAEAGRVSEEEAEPCPVCHEALGLELAMAPCGHQLCMRCHMAMLDRIPRLTPAVRTPAQAPSPICPCAPQIISTIFCLFSRCFPGMRARCDAGACTGRWSMACHLGG